MQFANVLTTLRDAAFPQRSAAPSMPTFPEGVGGTLRFVRDTSKDNVQPAELTMTYWPPAPFRVRRQFAPKMGFYAGLTHVSASQTAGNAYLPPPWIPKLRGASHPQRSVGGGASRAMVQGVYIPRTIG